MSQVGWIQVIFCGYCERNLIVEISNDRFAQIVEIAGFFACDSASLSRPFYSYRLRTSKYARNVLQAIILCQKCATFQWNFNNNNK